MQTAPRVSLINLGCAKNTVDSETALGALLSADFELVLDAAEADIVVVNTCGFIAAAREEALDVLREMLALKEDRPSLRVVAMGCLVQRSAAMLREALPALDGLLGFGAYADLVDCCVRVLSGERVVAVPAEAGVPLETAPRLLLSGVASAYLRIADGCDNRCSYCAVPLIRGPFRSRPPESIIEEARQLAANGVAELCLVAQDTTSYGQDTEGLGLTGLLRQLLAAVPEVWIRLLYAHPAAVTPELVAMLAGEERLLRYLDLPIQHIASPILMSMRRRMDEAGVRRLVESLRSAVPDLVLRTSVIVGYPEEGEAEFAKLLAFVAEGHFQHLGAFAYSAEADTPAGLLEPLPDAVVAGRLDGVMQAQQAVTFDWLDSRLGCEEEVMIEFPLPDGGVVGRSRGEAPEVDGLIRVPDALFSPGQRICACLDSRDGYDLLARSV